jgi:AcrR family transcriptional regulator
VTRVTVGAERQVRGERLIDKVLEATVEELAAKGYGATSVEDIAERAQVAKTTIYRRWPSKPDLVKAALARVAADVGGLHDTGSLRGDLVATLGSFRDFASSPRGGSLIRTMLGEGASAEVAEVARAIRRSKESQPAAVLARAVARGELPEGAAEEKVIFDLLFGAVQHYVLFLAEPCDNRKIERLVDLVLSGAQKAL